MKRILILGTFDGVHRGHQALLQKGKELQNELSAIPTVVTFSPHPALVLGKKVKLLTLPKERRGLLEKQGVCVEEILFDEVFAAMPAQQYIDFLCRNYDPAAIIVGANHTFGAKGSGTPKLIVSMAAKYGYKVFIEPSVGYEQQPISSTRIREALQLGHIMKANEMLGYYYGISGTVEGGQRIGRTIGFPTANLAADPQKILPGQGVYVTIAKSGEKKYCAITNIGVRPTVALHGEQTVESFLLNFDGELYEKEISLRFVHWLRPEKKFPDMKALSVQLAQDAAVARAYVSYLKETDIL